MTFPSKLLFTLALAFVAPPLATYANSAQKVDRLTTSSVLKAVTPSFVSITFKDALDAISNDNYVLARNLRDSLAVGTLEHKTLSWALAFFAGKNLPSADVAMAAKIAGDWPGAETLRINREKSLANENPSADQVIAAFGNTPPQTFDGALLLAKALKTKGENAGAVAALTPIWLKAKLEVAEEKAVITEFGNAISAAVHRTRMEAMLYDDRIAAAGRIAELADAKALYIAWAAVIRKDGNAETLLNAVPSKQRIAGYYFAKTRYLRRIGRTTEAASVMLSAPLDPDGLIDTNEWWNEQQILARDLVDLGKYELAYQIAANHVAGTAAQQGDGAFHAGWIALRFLNDPARSVPHFKKLAAITDGPISQARAYYWLGRAAEAGAPGNTAANYAQAANFATTYYGQLAAAKLGRKNLSIVYPQSSTADRQRFEGRELVKAAQQLINAGHAWRANPLIDALNDQINQPSEVALLAIMADNAGQNKMALQIGKASANRGVDVGALTHPLGAIPDDTQLSNTGLALAYAIARQESEFHVGAMSGAGALGLLQLMPATAKEVAARAGLTYSKARLTSDAGYNATLGARYLSEQIDRFDGSYILTFIAYNAGPRRADEWVQRYGNPKGKFIDAVVDWVELIPFAETRSYVQRVMENYQVYKWRLSGHYDIEEDLRFGRK